MWSFDHYLAAEVCPLELNLKKDQGVFRAKLVDVALMTANSNITTRSKTILCNLYEQRLSYILPPLMEIYFSTNSV